MLNKSHVALETKNQLMLEIDNDEIAIEINGNKIIFDGLEIQNSGTVLIATWECRAETNPIELINRDTK